MYIQFIYFYNNLKRQWMTEKKNLKSLYQGHDLVFFIITHI